MFRLFAVILSLAFTVSAAEARSSKKKSNSIPAGASFLGAAGGGGPRITSAFKGDPDKARFKNGATFWRGLEVERY